MPYADMRYDLKEHNPPSNALGFLGGLGKRSGTTRSKAHVQRPTMNQILFNMRTTNRILNSFSEDPIFAQSYTRKQQKNNERKSPKPIGKALKKDLNLTISRIQIADNVIKVTKGFKGSSMTSETEAKPQAKTETSTKVEGKRKPRGFSLGAMKKISIVSAIKISDAPKKAKEPQTFREWAIVEREKRHQALQQVSYQQIKQEREANEIFPKVKKPPKLFGGSRKQKKPLDLPGSQHLGGYLYGGFTKDTGPDITMENQTKFNVPYSMFSRAQVESKVRALSRKKIQRNRMDYMKLPQIPSDSENSDDIFEDIKGLSLVRTPYSFAVPTITHTKVKRMERLKSKHLKGNRLKRINILLFDRKLSAEKYKQKYASSDVELIPLRHDEKCDEGDDEGDEEEENGGARKDEKCKSSKLPEIVKKPIRHTFESQYRQRFSEYLHEKFLEQLEEYNEKLNQKVDEGATPTAIMSSNVTAKAIVERKSFRDYSIETMSSNIPSATPDIQKDPAFKRLKQKIRKNVKFSKSDNQTGGFYFDPFLLEKVHNPEKGMKIMKNYTSLMRSQSQIRKRLQVNAPQFDEERCGTKETGSFYHRLVTEWDSYYINEIRLRPTVQKFCVKTDIIKIREMVRKKFFLFFMQVRKITKLNRFIIFSKNKKHTHTMQSRQY